MRFLRRPTEGRRDAEKALAEAKDKLDEIRQRGPEVSQEADALKKSRETNHFIEQFEEIFIRPRRTFE